ncbi:hypothetical protein M758_12G125900 [Ceratodon purpureus]|nr:hypothetical protein M758_12G125900 [Ceratodon purpureus]
MISVRKALEFVNMSMLLQLVAGQNKLLAGQNRILELLEEARSYRAQPLQQIADQANSTMIWTTRYVCQKPSPISKFLKPIIHIVSNEDHELAAAEHGRYVIWKDPRTVHSKV